MFPGMTSGRVRAGLFLPSSRPGSSARCRHRPSMPCAIISRRAWTVRRSAETGTGQRPLRLISIRGNKQRTGLPQAAVNHRGAETDDPFPPYGTLGADGSGGSDRCDVLRAEDRRVDCRHRGDYVPVAKGNRVHPYDDIQGRCGVVQTSAEYTGRWTWGMFDLELAPARQSPILP